MSRVKRFAASIATGYVAMAVNIAYTMLSIPLALHYLGKEEFGLWALAQQISGYLMLLDLGMSSALSRFVSDHKDEAEGNNYGSLMLTGTAVFFVQGCIIIFTGLLFSFFAPVLFSIPPDMRHTFSVVLAILSVTAGVSVILRSLGSPLWAFHRLDVINLCAAMSLFFSFFCIWLGFRAGHGIYSFAVAGIPGMVVGTVVAVVVCYRNGYYPAKGRWGRPSWPVFRRVFTFGKDVLLMSLGSQLVNASQIMLISRLLSLEAAATFAVATKFYTMGQQFVSKILEGSAPMLTEMYVRRDFEKFRRRYWNVIALTASLGVVGGCCLILGNRAMVSLWTSKAISWNFSGDVLLAFLILITSLSRCFMGIHGIAGDLRPVRYIYLLEGLLFLLLAFPLGQLFGTHGVLLASLVAHLGLTGWVSLRSTKNLLGGFQEFTGRFISGLAILGIYSGLGFVLEMENISSRMSILLLIPGSMIACYLAWTMVLGPDIRTELSTKLRGILPRSA